ncbi:unnamed protein product [Ectocarpus sp. 12 AP-2014]
MWLANQTRPDILNAMRAGVRYPHAPKMLYWRAALHVLMYVRSTASYGITFSRGTAGGVELELNVDSDFASTATDRRSVSGAVVMCAGDCVSYLSRTQRSVTLSSAEATYVALADGLKEGIFLRMVWSFIFLDNHVGPMTVKEDNQGAIHLATASDGKHPLLNTILRSNMNISEINTSKSKYFNLARKFAHSLERSVWSRLVSGKAFRFQNLVLLSTNFPKDLLYDQAEALDPL